MCPVSTDSGIPPPPPLPLGGLSNWRFRDNATSGSNKPVIQEQGDSSSQPKGILIRNPHNQHNLGVTENPLFKKMQKANGVTMSDDTRPTSNSSSSSNSKEATKSPTTQKQPKKIVIKAEIVEKTTTNGDIETQTVETVPIYTKKPNKVLMCLAAISLPMCGIIVYWCLPNVVIAISGSGAIVAVPLVIFAVSMVAALTSAAYLIKFAISKAINKKEGFAKPPEQQEHTAFKQEPQMPSVQPLGLNAWREADGKPQRNGQSSSCGADPSKPSNLTNADKAKILARRKHISCSESESDSKYDSEWDNEEDKDNQKEVSKKTENKEKHTKKSTPKNFQSDSKKRSKNSDSVDQQQHAFSPSSLPLSLSPTIGIGYPLPPAPRFSDSVPPGANNNAHAELFSEIKKGVALKKASDNEKRSKQNKEGAQDNSEIFKIMDKAISAKSSDSDVSDSEGGQDFIDQDFSDDETHPLKTEAGKKIPESGYGSSSDEKQQGPVPSLPQQKIANSLIKLQPVSQVNQSTTSVKQLTALFERIE